MIASTVTSISPDVRFVPSLWCPSIPLYTTFVIPLVCISGSPFPHLLYHICFAFVYPICMLPRCPTIWFSNVTASKLLAFVP